MRSTTDSGIEEEVLPDDEYLLLTTALTAAENATPAAVSVFLTSSSRNAGATCASFLLTVLPRPRFPPPLHKALQTHSINKAKPHQSLRFLLAKFAAVRDLVIACRVHFSIPQALISVATYITNLVRSPVSSNHVISALSPSIWPRLHSFQQTGVLRAICTLHGRLLLADDMGLGKTVQALAVAEYYRNLTSTLHPLPVFIMCPPTLRNAWKHAVLRWLPRTNSDSVHVIRAAKEFERLMSSQTRQRRDPWDEAHTVQFVIVAYDLLSRIAHLCIPNAHQGDKSGLHFPIVIADECHTLRNKDTARTQAALPFILAADRRILISGTPVLSRPSELFPILTALLTTTETAYLSYSEYIHRYCAGDQTATRIVTHADELYLFLSKIMIRRVKKEVQQSLPPKIRRLVVLQLPISQLQPLRQMKTDLEKLMEQIGEHEQTQKECHDLYTRRRMLTYQLMHATARAKIPGVLTRLQQLIRNKQGANKILVFGRHLDVLDATEALACKECVSYIRIDGQVAASRRNELVEQFQTRAHVKIGILSIGVGSTGLCMTAADIVLFAELSWIPSELRQAEDRAHRLGRSSAVVVEFLVANESGDDLMWTAVKNKLDLVNRTVDGRSEVRREACDVSIASGERIYVSELAVETMRVEILNSLQMDVGSYECSRWIL